VRRRFLEIGKRRVHYYRAGEGPPVVLVHSSPGNVQLLKPEIERLSRDYTVFACDTPGFGRSDPLNVEAITLADLADALAETLAALDMPPCPMFGTHTGAAIALMFGARHPQRVTGLVLDGVPIFTAEECDALFPDYFRDLPVSDLGSQYAMAWTRFRDQSIWFPWSGRRPEHLNPYDLNTPAQTHLWVSMYFQAAKTYVPAYRAALYSRTATLRAAAALSVPTVYTATPTDMLFPHLKRLPTLDAGQDIRPLGDGPNAKLDLIAESFARFSTTAAKPEDARNLQSTRLIARQFIDRADGGQLHVRFAGAPAAEALLLLHDAPGSAAQLEPLIAALSRTYYVVAPDLPGAGESNPFERVPNPCMSDYVDAVSGLLGELGIERVRVYGVGFGASLALALAAQSLASLSGLVLEGVLAPSPEERALFIERYAPAIAVEADGAHWYRTWLMLRDSLVWWPWFDRRLAAQRRRPENFDADRLHDWTLDVMGARMTYGQFIQASLAHDAPKALADVRVPLTLVTGGRSPLNVYDHALQTARPDAIVINGAEDEALAQRLATLGQV
jgi:pimeloyl-ACP methyl ester carboxylesterase